MSLRRHKGAGNPEVELPITPMLDMAFQLLFFFVAGYNPRPVEGHMELALPSDKAAVSQKDPLDIDPTKLVEPKEDIDVSSEVMIVVRTQHSGDDTVGRISDIRVQQLSDPEGKSLSADLEKLLDYLKELRKGLGDKEAIKIQGDKNLKWANMVRVMDVCRKAGFLNISFAPPL
jgi:biopolymer transport protein ExbD